MASLFGAFDVRVDPWEVNYGSETPLEGVTDSESEDVAVDVEVHADSWKPIVPQLAPVPEHLWFVDGVRRLETRLLVRHKDSLLHGAFGSFAAGSVQMSGGTASFGPTKVGRQVVVGSGQTLPASIAVHYGLLYEPRSAKESEPDAPLRTIQSNMRSAEGELARELSFLPSTLVISDGPLSFEATGRGNAVGFIKRVTELYLPSVYIPLLIALPVQTRTPLFRIRGRRGGFKRLAWYIRLARARVGESELHGLARLEVQEDAGIDAAKKLASLTTIVLPQFAPSRGRDPRSPQNLLPIGALEQRLRHALGDPLLIRRWIQSLVAKETVHAVA